MMTIEEIQAIHAKAMVCADDGFTRRAAGDHAQARLHFVEAFNLEREAGLGAAALNLPEPSRSILLRSAATLALDAEQPREAEKLVAAALAGDPPDLIADELRDLHETVNLYRHLALRGIILEHNEFQVSLAGNMIGHGVALGREFLERIETVGKLVRRTIERKRRQPFQDLGRPSREVTEDYSLFLTVPRAASFAISIKIAQPSGQRNLPETLLESEIIDEVLSGLEHIEKKEEQALREMIPEESYYRNFVALAKAIAPDGESISMVGFTSARKTVALKSRRDTITASSDSTQEVKTPPDAPITVVGRLLFADARKASKREVRLIDKTDKEYTLRVPEGMMADIVKPLWESVVEIVARPRPRRLIGRAELDLIEIKKA